MHCNVRHIAHCLYLFPKICWSYTADTVNDLFMCSALSSWFYCYAENMDTIILYGICYGEEAPFASFPSVVEGR